MSNLKLQKVLAAKTFKVGKDRVKLNFESREDIKNAITKADIRELTEAGDIKVLPLVGTSRHRARARKAKQKKGRQKGHGRRKGKASARTPSKTEWINRVRLQRKTLAELKEKGELTSSNHRMLYLKSKGGFFRSKKHLLQYISNEVRKASEQSSQGIEQNKLVKKVAPKKKPAVSQTKSTKPKVKEAKKK